MKTVGGLAMAALLLAFAAKADPNYVSSEGHWRWNAQASHYGVPPYAREQTMEVIRDDGTHLKFSQDIVMADGTKYHWSFDGLYDGKVHPGDWISVGVKRTAYNTLSDHYVMKDGTKGKEVETISANQLVIKGSSTDPKGKKNDYVEVWDRVP